MIAPWYTRLPLQGVAYRAALQAVANEERVLGRDLTNTLYYGDNLEILTRFMSDETVDLVYLDPPFNKNAAYSLIFHDESGRTSDAQMATLEDYWHWGPTPERHYGFLTNSSEHRGQIKHAVSDLIGALHSAIGPSPLLAYLVEMTMRLTELHRVLKPTGSLYFHCDPTASHYLKLLLDAIFGPERFLGEIIWKRTGAHSSARRPGPVHDTILLYGKTDAYIWNVTYAARDPEYVRSHYSMTDDDGRRFQPVTLHASGTRRGSSGEPWRGIDITAKGGHWKYAIDGLNKLDAAGKIYWPTNGGMPRLKQYLDDGKGTPLQDIWTDISPVNAVAKERLGYPTQKPIALLARIIEASSNPGAVVLDPFCGCGTAIEAAVATNRSWVGIDISNLAVGVIQDRLAKIGTEVPVFDWPTEMDGIQRMVEGPGGRHRFEVWALTRLGLGENRRGADGGLDGRIGFTGPGGRLENIIVSVKSGHVGSPAVRDLKGTMTRERSAMGLLFTFEKPSPSAVQEAVESGFYRSPIDGRQYPKVVIHTVRELFEGRLPELPIRHGIQPPIWPMPASTRSVRLRPARRPTASTRVAARPPISAAAAAAVRDDYARSAEPSVSPAAPRSPRRSRRDQPVPQPSPESADTD